jgi:hypothetical protein
MRIILLAVVASAALIVGTLGFIAYQIVIPHA